MELLKKHILFLNHNPLPFPDIHIQFNTHYNNVDFQVDLYHLLKRYKDEIEVVYHSKKWDSYKKLTNQFEMVNLNEIGYNGDSVVDYNPISRAYFKLWEIVKDFDLVDFSSKRIVIVGLAEGPGGFVECIYNMRKKYSIDYKDKCVCITLKSYRNRIPGWNKSGNLFDDKTIHKYKGEDETGNLYKRINIEGLSTYVGNDKADIVTADGGFDFSTDYSKQEQLSYRLQFCQIVGALGTLKTGGHFVLKIFDIFTTYSVRMIYFLTSLFEQGVYIVKPHTSRPANSEKYVVCKGFIGIEPSDLEKMYSVVDDWDILDNQRKYVENIFNIHVPTPFDKVIESYNIYSTSRQIQTILKTFSYIHAHIQNKDMNNIKQKQAIIGLLWCKKYDLPINYNCTFLNVGKEYYNYIL